MSALENGRAAFDARAWTSACEHLQAADTEGALGAQDLLRLGAAAQLCGNHMLSDDARQRAYRECRDRGDQDTAARAAFMLGLNMMNRGDPTQGAAWMGRAMELVEAMGHDSAERGYVTVAMGLRALGRGEPDDALSAFTRVLDIGERFADQDLRALGRLGIGQSLLNLGRTSEGLDHFDQVMVSIVAEETSAIVAGIVYCAVIEGCHDIGELGRCREWTRALSRWCDEQPDLVAFRGRCLVHRSEILQLEGAWEAARDEAVRACSALSEPPGQPPLGAALYQLGELQRLSGELEAAADTFQRASEHGRDPQPGLALVRLADGDPVAADATLARVLDEGHLQGHRPAILAARVETALAAGDIEAARAAEAELSGAPPPANATALGALAASARGRLALAEGDPRRGLQELRSAAEAWGTLGAVYELARVREVIGRACAAVGDLDGADFELGSARATYERLGATGDLARLGAGEPEPTRPDHGAGLTGREMEVLRHVAAGSTNRQIAEALTISEKTVARHVSNIFTKLGVGSRAAATAYAFTHDLI